MFSPSPRYLTLPEQVARLLEEQIRAGTLRDSLPGERRLAASLQVGRRTIRGAAAILRRRKLVHTVHGVRTRIQPGAARRGGRGASRTVGLLVPQPLRQLQPYATVFLDPLRELLRESGFQLETLVGRSFFSRRPAAALRRLVARSPCDGWLLLVSNRACQSWFHAQGLPAVVIGSAHDGISLPCVDLDMLATARHAAQVLLGRGHRRVGLVIGTSEWVGDRRTEEGFREGVRRFGRGSSGAVFRHQGTVASLRRTLDRLLSGPTPPTGLLVVNPYAYLTIAALLAERGVRVPRHVSLLCRDDEYFLRHVPVTPSRYTYEPEARAKEIFALLMAALNPGGRQRPGARAVLMLPRFEEGGSIAPPP